MITLGLALPAVFPTLSQHTSPLMFWELLEMLNEENLVSEVIFKDGHALPQPVRQQSPYSNEAGVRNAI